MPERPWLAVVLDGQAWNDWLRGLAAEMLESMALIGSGPDRQRSVQRLPAPQIGKGLR